jgi:hypothetical protein
MQMLGSELQRLNRFLLLSEMPECASKRTNESLSNRAKLSSSKPISDAGIENSVSEEQRTNARRPMRPRLDPDSNVTLRSPPHREKHSVERITTVRGMEIERRQEHSQKADSPISIRVEGDSNVTAESRLQDANHLP